jgi:hypothetical protein
MPMEGYFQENSLCFFLISKENPKNVQWNLITSKKNQKISFILLNFKEYPKSVNGIQSFPRKIKKYLLFILNFKRISEKCQWKPIISEKN